MTNDVVLDGERALLRHAIATLAYRASKALRDLPPEAAEFRVAPEARTPHEITAHLADLMEWATRLARGDYRWEAGAPQSFESARERFFRGLSELDAALVEANTASRPLSQIFQSAVADALTHVGQIALLRGLAGSRVRPESFARADIQAGRVGFDQTAPLAEFDGDASRPPRG